jgi:hypothetical protein
MFGRIAIVGAAISAAAAAAFVAARRQWRTWGIDPQEAIRELPGDDLVDRPDATETRGIDIDAPPEAVWPWLIQMGYGRGGWYSYDAIGMDRGSTRVVLPDLQSLAVDDVVPTHPGGGLVVKVVEPERHLVLYLDSEIARRQSAEHPLDEATPNVQATDRFMDFASGEFAASWAFVLEPTTAGGTRLIERVRARMEAPAGATVLARRLFGFGVFVMLRRQLLGIRERALIPPPTTIPGEPTPVPA